MQILLLKIKMIQKRMKRRLAKIYNKTNGLNPIDYKIGDMYNIGKM